MDEHDTKDRTGMKFFFVTILNALITFVEFTGGIFSGSLGLISDAFHNLEDALSVLFSYIAHLIGRKDTNERQTFGYTRAEILAAFVNSAILIAITIILVIESIRRIGHPEHVNGGLMLAVSFVGLAFNLLSAIIMLKDAKKSLNVKATFLHMAADALSSIGVMVAALFIKFFGWEWADPVITILTSCWIMKESYGVIKQTVSILMEASPKIDLEAVKKSIMQLPEVVNVHHVHIWRIDEHLIAFDAHINVRETETMDQLEDLYARIRKLLKDKYGINHVTLQAECHRGMDETLVHGDKAERKQKGKTNK